MNSSLMRRGEIKYMKIQIFILDGHEDRVLIDRRFAVIDGNAPRINLQDIVDDAVKQVTKKKVDAMELEARRLIAQDKENS